MIADHGRPQRFDIQLLRGVAVLLVMAFHAFERAVPRGWLGVDIFFVISGFLMTRIILEGLEDGSFSLRGFYMRRVRRLVPAAMTTIAATTALSALLLTHFQWREYLLQLAGAATFTANFVLWDQGGYFDLEVETRPLLHFWSLAVEEQFYLLFPLVLLLLPRRLRVPALFAGFLASLALFLAVRALGHHAAAFYMLPTRLWQLLAGALCAWAMARRPDLWIPAIVKLAALASILAVCLDYLPARHGPVIAVAATALLLLGRDGWIPDRALTRPLARIGDWSYSLYLVHWPLLALAASLHAGAVPLAWRIGLVVLAFPLGWLQHRWVEERYRRPGSAGLGRFLAAAAATIAALVAIAPQTRALGQPALEVPGPVFGLAEDCALKVGGGHDPRCRTAPEPRVALWGDSFAMHLLPGLIEALPAGTGIVQYTAQSCTPLLGGARPGEAPCLAMNERIASALARSRSIDTVILSSTWELISLDRPRGVLLADGRVLRLGERETAAIAIETVRALQAMGKRVLIVGPTPMEPHGQLDPPLCNIRELEGRPRLGGGDCAVSLAGFRLRMPAVRRNLERISAETGARLFLPEDALCRAGRCATREGRRPLYRDENHLSHGGSIALVRRLGLAQAAAACTASPQAQARECNPAR